MPSPSGSHVLNLEPRANLRHDAPAGLVVALVALPLCMGIAIASGAPPASGLIAGMVGGLVVPWFTGSPLSVSGPAAGLTAIVLTAIGALGLPAFLTAVCLAGALQFLVGLLRGGLVAYYFPTSVIRGLLTAIGLILILKQIPHALGVDTDPEGEMVFEQIDGRNTFTEIPYAFEHAHVGALVIALVGLAVLLAIDRFPRLKVTWAPGPLVVVVLGIGLNLAFRAFAPSYAVGGALLIDLGDGGVLGSLPAPDPSVIFDPGVLKAAVTLAIVASLESLLCVEAMDRLDPYKRSSDPNKELRAQGIGNVVSGVLGGLPLTCVIVRGSTAVNAGGRTPAASFFHGVILTGAVLLLPGVLEQIPLAALAAVLLHVGYKLVNPGQALRVWRAGGDQFIPFGVTVAAILFTDLLIGVTLGLAAGVFFILRANFSTPFFIHARDDRAQDGIQHIHIELSQQVSFLNKASVTRALHELPDESIVVIDGSSATYIDQDVLELIHEFAESAHHRGIEARLVDVPAPGNPDKRRTRWAAQERPLVPKRALGSSGTEGMSLGTDPRRG